MFIFEYYPVFTGHGIYLQQLIEKLQLLNCDIKILTVDFNKYPRTEVINGVKVYRIPFSHQERFSEIKLSVRVIKFLITHLESYDILHIHGHLDTYGLITLFNKLLHKHTITQMVLLGADDPITLKKIYKFMNLRLRILCLMDRFVCISRPLYKSCIKANIPKEKITYIPQGVNMQRFLPPYDLEAKYLLRKKLNLPINVPIVIFIGAIVERKGVDRLIKAWKKIQCEHPSAWLVMVGQNYFNELDINQFKLNFFVKKIRDIIHSHNLRVIMTGKKSNVEQFLQCADLFVLTSRKEGFGNVILEAMSCGLPVIVTSMDGVAMETVVHGVNGFIEDSTDRIAMRISQLINNRSLALKMGMAGRAIVEQKFSITSIAEDYIKMYTEIMCKTQGFSGQ